MKVIKKSAVVFVAVICLFSLCVNSSAEGINMAEWNTGEFDFYEIATKDVPSNSGLTTAFLKVRYEEEPHRMVMLFMLKFNSFTEEDNPGIDFSLNGGEMLSLSLNGEAEYNEEDYYIDFTTLTTPVSGVVYFEVIFGVKAGLPEEKVLTLIFRDPQGVPSNTYTLELSTDEFADSQEDMTNEDTTQTKTTKTEKQSKTTKTKTTKTTTVKNSADNLESETKTESSLEKETKDEKENVISPTADKKVLFTFGGIFVAAALVLTGGLQFLKRKKHKGD